MTEPAVATSPHLLGLDGMSRTDLELFLQNAAHFYEVLQRPLKKVPALRGQTIVNLFFEPSTRTRLSFELAAKRLSADVVNFSASTSSVTKGETFLDTARTIEAMHADLVIVRHKQAGAAHFLSQRLSARVVNAGDGYHEHPTQALLDAFTLLRAFGRGPQDGLAGKKVAIIGDIAHSRVARSNIFALLTLGADVVIYGPKTLLPAYAPALGARLADSLDDALGGADAVMMLRIQKERLQKASIPSDNAYRAAFGLTRERADALKPECVVLHPGPMNRGVEIAPEVADSKRNLILDQVENGVAVRMAVLYVLLAQRRRPEDT